MCDNPCLILVFDVVTHKDVLGLRGMASTYEIVFFFNFGNFQFSKEAYVIACTNSSGNSTSRTVNIVVVR